jgi:hypothetical protein
MGSGNNPDEDEESRRRVKTKNQAEESSRRVRPKGEALLVRASAAFAKTANLIRDEN